MLWGDWYICQEKMSDGASLREEKACPDCPLTKNRPEMGLERLVEFSTMSDGSAVSKVLPLTTVDNSDFAPTRLTAHPTLLRISKLFLPHLSSNEDSDGPSCIHVPARGLSLPFAGAALASVLVPSSVFLLTSRGQAQHAPPSAQAPLARRLPRLSSRLRSLLDWRASACSCASLARGEKPPGRTQAREDRGLCLSQPAVPLLRDHRCSDPRPGRRWHARTCRAHPDLSLSGLPYHLQCSTPYAVVPFENPLSEDCHGAHSTGRRARPFGYRRATITIWLTRAGKHAELFHERRFRNLYIPHLQLDEIRTRLRSSTQVLWLWLAIDPRTKILPMLHLGSRTQHAAHLLIHSLRQLLAPDCLPLFTSDGLNVYFYALTAHFGHWLTGTRRGRIVRQWKVAAGLIYGQVKKCYRRRKLVRVTHVMRLGTQADLTLGLQGLGFSGRLNTAFIERVNLTVRQGVAALARRTWATAQQSTHLLASLEWWRAYYHFVRPHEALRVALVQPQQRGGNRLAHRYRQRTPAMAAGRTTRRWTAREVLSCPLLPIST
jgi:IS1 family transposase